MPFGVDAEYRLSVGEQRGGGMAKVLSGNAIHRDLTGGLLGEIEEGEARSPGGEEQLPAEHLLSVASRFRSLQGTGRKKPDPAGSGFVF
jgi:hypothetical protein